MLQVPKIPMLNSNFDAERSAAERGVRTGLKPWNVVQPQGPSFEVDGNHVNWQKWDFRVSFNYREGLVLHDIKSVFSSFGLRQCLLLGGLEQSMSANWIHPLFSSEQNPTSNLLRWSRTAGS